MAASQPCLLKTRFSFFSIIKWIQSHEKELWKHKPVEGGVPQSEQPHSTVMYVLPSLFYAKARAYFS